MKFRPITIDDKPLFDKYIKEETRSSYNFFTNYAWCGDDKLLICEENNCLYILWNIGNRSFMLFPRTQNADISSCIYNAVEYMKSIGVTPKFSSLNASDIKLLKSCNNYKFQYDYNRNGSDYIYLSDALINLSGKKLHQKRNHINAFCRDYNYIYRKIEQTDIQNCKALFDKWYSTQSEDAHLLKESRNATFKILDSVNQNGLIGGIIEVDGNIVACSVGERITPEMALIHIEFADTEYRGSYSAINQMFVKNEWQDCKYINREEDMGDEGLRKAKESYQPEKINDIYTATLVE